MNGAEAKIIGQDITVAYGDYVLLKDADFTINKGDIFFIMGVSGGGKTVCCGSLLDLCRRQQAKL